MAARTLTFTAHGGRSIPPARGAPAALGGCSLATMAIYSDSTPVRQARAEYFRANGFGDDGGYDARWVKVKLGRVPLWFPNTAARRRAVRLHDLHHLATDYDTSLVGESEIGAWELAAGCGHYSAAWALNTAAVLLGLFVAPRRIWRAFLRGRRSETLYRMGCEDRVLDETVGALRRQLHLTGTGDAAA